MLLRCVTIGVPADGQAHIAGFAAADDRRIPPCHLVFARHAEPKTDGIDQSAHAVWRNDARIHPRNIRQIQLSVVFSLFGRKHNLRARGVKQRARRADDCFASAVFASGMVIQQYAAHRRIPHFFRVSFSRTRSRMYACGKYPPATAL